MGTLPEQNDNIFFKEGCSNSANLMSARLAFSRRFHRGSLLCFFLWSPNSWVVLVLCAAESVGVSSDSTEHNDRPRTPCRFSVEADLALWRVFDESEGVLGCRCWMRPREPTGRWDRRERAVCGRRGCRWLFQWGWSLIWGGVFGLKGLGEVFWRKWCWSDVSFEGCYEDCFESDWGFDCGCNWAND